MKWAYLAMLLLASHYAQMAVSDMTIGHPRRTYVPCLINRNISAHQRNLSYEDGSQHHVSLPYPLWSSIQISAHVAFILLTEVMNYATDFYQMDTIDDSVVLAAAIGCLHPEDHVCEDRDTGDPKVHFTLETWITGDWWQSSTLPAAAQATLLNTLDYRGVDGYFLWPAVIERALSSPSRLVLDHYHAYNASLNDPAAFFDPWRRILELVPAGLILPCSTSGPPEDPYSSPAYAALTGDTAGCGIDPRVWFSPACRANTSRCVPTLIQYAMPAAAQLAYFLDMPLAVVYVLSGDSNYAEYYAAVRAGRFLFGYYTPNDALIDDQGRLPEQAPPPPPLPAKTPAPPPAPPTPPLPKKPHAPAPPWPALPSLDHPKLCPLCVSPSLSLSVSSVAVFLSVSVSLAISRLRGNDSSLSDV